MDRNGCWSGVAAGLGLLGGAAATALLSVLLLGRVLALAVPVGASLGLVVGAVAAQVIAGRAGGGE